MKIIDFNKIIVLGASVLALASCTKDLDRTPIVGQTSAVIYSTPTNIKQVLAKLYAGYTLSGQDASTGFPTADITSNDAGANVYMRNWWNAQELSTDEVKIAWGDGDLQQYNTNTWTPTNSYMVLWYNRIFYEVSICNEFLRQIPAAKIAAFSTTDAATVQTFVYEAKFLRALAYYHAIDNFGNVPFTTENDAVGKGLPKQVTRDSLFRYVENELLAVQAVLPAPGLNEYGRVDQAAAWTLLAKLYLNAKVYTGTDRSTDCLTYCNKIIASGKYSLSAKYANLFKTDNHTTSNEIIFALRANGVTSQSYGNTTYLIHAAVGGSMNAKDSFGIASGGWYGIRSTKNLVNLYADPSGKTDQRAMFYTPGQVLEMTALSDFSNGYAVSKFKNVSSTGVAGSDPGGNFSDLDFPLFRLADVYLMYAEAVLRGGTGGSVATALGYINALRTRAYGNTNGNIAATALTLPFILDERGRELYWEGYRRTDLIRFGVFTGGTYLWPWKGNALAGTSVDAHLNLYPLSATDVNINSNLTQNIGY